MTTYAPSSHVSAIFQLPAKTSPRHDAITKFLAQVTSSVLDERVKQFTPPWSRDGVSGSAACFVHQRTAGVYLPLHLELEVVQYWFESHVALLSIVESENADLTRFTAIATAKCTECESQLDLMDSVAHGFDTEHLACMSCGGMFEVALFVEMAIYGRDWVQQRNAPPKKIPGFQRSSS